MSDGAYYIDPSSEGWVSPNLISGLMKCPPIQKQHPLERSTEPRLVKRIRRRIGGRALEVFDHSEYVIAQLSEIVEG